MMITPIKRALFGTLLCLLSTTSFAQEKVWTKTSPAINVTHIFKGEINRRGKPTGLHAKFNNKLPKSSKIIRIKGKPNAAGVYTADVAINDPKSDEWKRKFSSMFPDKLSAKEVLTAILHAYKNREPNKKRPWRGPSGHGFTIEGYLLKDGRINTAYPIYVRDK